MGTYGAIVIQKTYSKINNCILYIVCRPDKNRKSETTRINVSPDEEFLQFAVLDYDYNKEFKPHFHKYLSKQVDITQEAWVVIRGKVLVQTYDLDNSLVEDIILTPGDCFISYRGGHGYHIREDNTLVYEFKTGPYFGQMVDKEYFND